MYCFFFNGTATTEIYTLSLHDALPISRKKPVSGATEQGSSAPPSTLRAACGRSGRRRGEVSSRGMCGMWGQDRKSTRLNSSHANTSYAVFCLKKNNYKTTLIITCARLV